MSIRKRILIPMIALTVGGCIAVLVSSMLLFSRELSDAKYTKIDVAALVAENEIEELMVKAEIAAYAMSQNADLIDSIIYDDLDRLISTVDALLYIAQVDFCTIIDADGNVITRTHGTATGDNLSHLPHVKVAMTGGISSYITQGNVVSLGAYAGAPIYDENENLIGVVSLGTRFDTQDFAHKLRDISGCEVSVFLQDIRISTTLIDEDGAHALGSAAPEHISASVLSGVPHVGEVYIFGKNMLTKYSPLVGANEEIVGMIFVGYDTAEDDSKILVFTLTGVLITCIVLAVCIALAMFISGVMENRLEKMMQQIADAQFTTSAMFESSPQSNILFDSDFNIIDCNPAALRLMGFDTKEEMLVGFSDRLSAGIPEYQPNGRRSLSLSDWAEKAMKEGYVKFETELILAGKKMNLNVEFRKIPYEGSFAFVVYIYDMTEVHEREMELFMAHSLNEVQLSKLNLMVKAAKIGLWDMEVTENDPVNPNNPFIWSDDFRHMLGYENENDFPNVLKSLLDVMHPADIERTNKAFARHLLDYSGNTPFNVEYRLMKKNGGYSYFRAMGETVRDDDGVPVSIAGALIDISDAKEAERVISATNERLLQARDTAEAANKSKSIFLANMSHEIRTPMNSIIGFSELAQDDEISPKTRQYLSNISDNAKWLLNIINDILDNTKIESGKVELERIPFDAHDVISQCQSAILPKTVEKGFALYCYSEPLFGKKLLGDPVRLRQVLMNLLSNAVKFTSTGSVKLLASIKEQSDDETTLSFEIKDSGIGMSPEQVARIFDPYMQADDSVTRRFGGTGLGLPISKSLVEMMGGSLSVESVPGAGSTFSFELRFDLVDDTDVKSAKEISISNLEKPSFNAEVLICEDNHLNQQVICDHLARVGIQAVVANNGQEGIDIIEERIKSAEGEVAIKPFDLIFMDIHMPVMDGLEAAYKISGLGVKTPIVALTANIMSNDLELYKTNGMNDFLGKPFTSQELWRCLMKYLPVTDFVRVDIKKQTVEEDNSLKQLRKYFAESNQDTFEKIKQALDAEDIKLAHRLAHTLKSNAGQIGEKRLQEVAAEVESMLSEGKNRLSNVMTKMLESELNLVLDKLAPFLIEDEKEASEAAEPLTPEQISEIIEKLEPMLSGYSTECVDMIDEVRRLPGADELARCIDDFEFKQALIELAKVKEELGIS